MHIKSLLTISSLALFLSFAHGNAQTTMAKSPDQPAAPKTDKTTPPAVSGDPTATTASFGDWTLRCAKVSADVTEKLCEVVQTFTAQGQTAPLAQIALGRTVPNEPLKVTVVLPNNVTLTLLPRVLADSDVETNGMQLPWQRCLPGGCFASAPVREDEMTKWLTAIKPGAILFADGTGRKLKLPISFRGLEQALDTLGDK
jgi:invasion protein IalB